MRGHEDQASGTLCRWKPHKGARASGRVVRAQHTGVVRRGSEAMWHMQERQRSQETDRRKEVSGRGVRSRGVRAARPGKSTVHGWCGSTSAAQCRLEVKDGPSVCAVQGAEGRPSGTEHGTKGAGGGGAKRCGTLGVANGRGRPNITDRRNVVTHELEIGSVGCMLEERDGPQG
jgi:hypothetical protein